jgi:methionyl-tRNA formyltransferase
VAQAGAKMLREHLSGLLTGTAPRRRQVVHHFDRKLPRRIPEMDVTSFARTSVEVNNWIRALTRPGTGAFGYIRGQRLVLWKAEALEGRTTRAPAGTVLGTDGDGVVVTTRTGAVRLLEVQADGRRPESAAAWFARTGWKPGCVFDAVDAATLAWSLGKGPRPDPHTDVSPERRELRRKGSRS